MSEIDVMDIEELAKLLDKKPSTIKADCYRKPDSLPPRMRGTSRYRWVKSQVVEWLSAQGQNPELQKLRSMDRK